MHADGQLKGHDYLLGIWVGMPGIWLQMDIGGEWVLWFPISPAVRFPPEAGNIKHPGSDWRIILEISLTAKGSDI
jgi:hypothetical protein